LQNLEQLANGIAHDFNNVLHTVMSAAEMIKLKQDDQAAPLAETIIQATSSAAGLIKRMQHLTVRQPRESRPVSLHRIVEKTVQLFRQHLDHGIVVSMTLNARRFSLRGDESQLEHMLLNLYLNARDALPNGGTVCIGTSDFTNQESPITPLVGALQSKDSYVVLTVEDSGYGMDPETLRRMFQPFFTTRAGTGGTGLGLLGVEAAVTAHGGAISVDSKPDDGSRFSLYLPVDPAPVLSSEQARKSTRN